MPRATTVLGVAAYLLIFHWWYLAVVSPQYAYMGCIYEPQVPELVLLAWFFALLPSVWMPISSDRPSLWMYWILYIMAYVPGSLLPWYRGASDPYTLFLFSTALLGAFGLAGAAYRLPLLRVRPARLGRTVFWIVIGVASAVLYGIILSAFGFRLNIVSLEDVYDVRADFKDALLQTGPLVVYAINWQANAINPLLIARGFLGRNPVLIAAGVFGQLVIYSITGFKSMLFSGVMVLALWIGLRYARRRYVLYLIAGSAGLILAMALVHLACGWIIGTSLAFRTYVIPGLLTSYYFEFFSINPKTLLADSILRPFFDYPYSAPVATVIGSYFFNSPTAYANANVWAYAYASFGMLGMLLFSALLAATMWIFDSVSYGRDYRLIVLLLAIPAFTLANSSLLTCLLTHGLGLVIALVYLLPEQENVAAAPVRRSRRPLMLPPGAEARYSR